MRAWALALGLAGCDPAPEGFAACEDAPCRQTWVMDHWDGDPDGVTRALRGVREPMERLVLVTSLAEAYPRETESLCALLASGQGRERCAEIVERATSPGGIPDFPELEGRGGRTPPEDVGRLLVSASTWPDLSMSQLADCPAGQEGWACRAEEAQAAARRDQPRHAARACNGVIDRDPRYACYLDASAAALEQDAEGLVLGRLDTATTLCGGAGDRAPECVSVLYDHLASLVPPADVADPQAWAPARRAIDGAYGEMARVDVDLAELFVDRLWADALARSMVAAKVPTGQAMGLLPREARWHLRAAVAWRTVGEAPVGASLDELVLQTQQALDRGGADNPVKVGGPVGVTEYWGVVVGAERELSRVHFLGDARRAISDDPEAELLLCVLEAAAQDGPARADAIAEAFDDERPLVRWTAARLLTEVDREHPGVSEVGFDSSPLVQTRTPRGARPRR